MLVTVLLSEPPEIHMIENSVQEKTCLEILEKPASDCNASTLFCFLLILSWSLYRLQKTYFWNGLTEYDFFESFQLKQIHGSYALEYFNLGPSTSLRNQILAQLCSFLAF